MTPSAIQPPLVLGRSPVIVRLSDSIHSLIFSNSSSTSDGSSSW
jgi:hypothetical protein